jgi:superfamily II DNA/RNA helicase
MMVPATAQFVYQAHDLDKPEIVARILQAENRNRVMIFCRTKRWAQRLADDLADRGFAVAPIHGDLNQALREKALKRFREGKINVLVATDVAARGIDVEGITHVINYECPDDDKAYVHRIGRTGRAGASGIAVTFVDWADQTRWKVINSTLGLPFEEPEETYSTSAHLFHDLGIDPAAKGRLTPPKPPRAREDGEDRKDRKDRKERRAERPKKTGRRRLRNGVPVEQAETTELPVAAEPGPETAASAAGVEGAEPERTRRRRRRNRSRPVDRGPHPRSDEVPSA